MSTSLLSLAAAAAASMLAAAVAAAAVSGVVSGAVSGAAAAAGSTCSSSATFQHEVRIVAANEFDGAAILVNATLALDECLAGGLRTYLDDVNHVARRLVEQRTDGSIWQSSSRFYSAFIRCMSRSRRRVVAPQHALRPLHRPQEQKRRSRSRRRWRAYLLLDCLFHV